MGGFANKPGGSTLVQAGTDAGGAVGKQSLTQQLGPPPLIVDGDATAPGQEAKGAFLDRLERDVIDVAADELGALAGAASCPYIERAFAKYRGLPAASVVQLIQRWIASARSARSAGELIPLVLERVRAGVRRWQETHELPPELEAADPALAAAAREPAGGQRQSLDALERDLGSGSALDGATAARMSSALGTDVGRARVHTGPAAQAKAAEQDAAAFAVGDNVVMGAGAPPPGTVHGDALLAHELAHTAQQRGAATDPAARRRPIGDEEQSAETDANRQVEQAARGGTSLGDILTTGLQLQRCATAENKAPVVENVVQKNIPPPQMLRVVGDWFQVRWNDDGFSALAVRYDGPLEPHFGREIPLRVEYDRTRLLNPTVTAKSDDTIVYDLYSDNSTRVIVSATAEPAEKNQRKYLFSASVNGAAPPEFGTYPMWLKLPEPGKPAPAGMPAADAAREAAVTKHLDLVGDGFDFTARRFGDTNQVHLHIAGPTFRTINDPPPGDATDLVPLAAAPERLGLDIQQKGGEIFLDLDGDKRPDVRIVHTMRTEPRMREQVRTHILRTFDMDGVFLKEHRYASVGPPIAIPNGLDETTNAPDTNVAWPADRPPGQADVPGQQPEAIHRPGNITELRIDGDGDRAKELMLRFKPLPSQQDAPVELELVRLDGADHAVRSAKFTTFGVNDQSAGRLPSAFAHVTQVTDGRGPTLINYALGATPSKLTISPPQIADQQWTYLADADGQRMSFSFPAPKEPVHALVAGTPPGAVKAGDLTSYDLPVGEYGDLFRFQLDQNRDRTTFTVRPLAHGAAVGAVDVPVPSWTTGMKLAPGDPRTIAFDLGRGPSDLVIYDRLEAGTDPASNRTHVLTLTGPGVAKEQSLRFLALGVLQAGQSKETPLGAHEWSDKESNDAVLAAQADQGDFAGFEKRIDAALVAARKKALDDGLIQKRLYAAWEALSLLLIELDAERAAVAKDRSKAIDKGLVTRAADGAKELHDALEAESISVSSKEHGRPANKFTKRATWNHKPGAGIALQRDLRAGLWEAAELDYANVVDGLDMWITHQLGVKGADGAGAQHEYLRGVSREMADIEKHNPLRVMATFTPEEDRESHVPLNLFVYKDGGEWHLKDLSNPKDTFDDTIDATTDALPPDALFQKLNWKKHFPVGTITYRVPGGRDGTVECTGKRKWYDWFADVSLGLAVIGITALTAGAGTVAAIALAGAGVTGAVAAGGDLQDSISHNHADTRTVVMDVAQIVGGFLGAGQVLGGRLIKVAAAADEAVTAGVAGSARVSGAWASLAGLAGRHYVTLSVGSAASNAVTLGAMTAEAIDAIAAIMNNKTLGDAERRVALTRIIGQFLLVGGITFMAVKGDIATSLDGRPPIEIVDIGGQPVVVTAGTKVVPRPPIGQIVATDGSITRTGKQRLAEIPADTRKRLLVLDQHTMGKLLTLDDAGLANVAKLDDAALKKLAELHTLHLQNLSPLPETDLAVVANLDVATIEKLARVPADMLVPLSPLTEAKIRGKLSDVDAVDANVRAELGDPDVAHHLRDTNFPDRGVLPNKKRDSEESAGNVKIVVPATASAKAKTVAVEANEYVRLEAIPSPPAPTPVTITSVSVTGIQYDAAKKPTVTGDVQVRTDGDLYVPRPGLPNIDVTVKTSAGDFPFTSVENPPPGTRVGIRPTRLAKDGFSGGHTRDAWTATENTYGDMFSKTSEQSIQLKLPGSPKPVDLTSIRYEVKVPTKGAVPVRDPKTIFEKPGDLDAFEKHARPYMSAKMDALRTPPTTGNGIVTVDVPVQTAGGTDASVRVAFPWRVDASTGKPDIGSWWIDHTAFAKGSPFNP